MNQCLCLMISLLKFKQSQDLLPQTAHQYNSVTHFIFIMILLELVLLAHHMDHFSETMLEKLNMLKNILNYLEMMMDLLPLLLETKRITKLNQSI